LRRHRTKTNERQENGRLNGRKARINLKVNADKQMDGQGPTERYTDKEGVVH
jgi:hypothetical protein